MFPEACNLWQASGCRLQNEEGIGESLPIPFRIFLHVRATIMYIAQTLLSADKTFKSVS